METPGPASGALRPTTEIELAGARAGCRAPSFLAPPARRTGDQAFQIELRCWLWVRARPHYPLKPGGCYVGPPTSALQAVHGRKGAKIRPWRPALGKQVQRAPGHLPAKEKGLLQGNAAGGQSRGAQSRGPGGVGANRGRAAAERRPGRAARETAEAGGRAARVPHPPASHLA